MLNRITTTLIVAVFSFPASALDISEYHLVDLSHSYGDDTLYWPTAPSRFEKTVISFGETESGGFYSAFSICTPEHGGTHLDAPMHFARDKTCRSCLSTAFFRPVPMCPGLDFQISQLIVFTGVQHAQSNGSGRQDGTH